MTNLKQLTNRQTLADWRKKKSIYIVLFHFVLFTSCGDKAKAHRKELIEQNNAETVALITKWGALMLNDSIKEYTYWFQESLIEHKKPLAIKGELSDIYKSDSNYVLQIIVDGYKNKYIAQIIIDSSRMEKMKETIDPHDKVRGCFVFKVVKVISKSPLLTIDYDPGTPPNQDGDGGEDPSVSLDDMESGKITTFKGYLLDYSLIGK